ncbi:MAG: hydantoinase/oxoprolinase family protein [Pirellulales bacterium]
MDWLGLDVGGANLKIASFQGYARSVPFPLWQQPQELTTAIRELISSAPHADGVAVTMTGELADCFETKSHGVLHILEAVERAAAPNEILIYRVDGQFVSVDKACSEPLLAAASNWHALARCACRWIERFPAVLIDVGSTTTDIIPLLADGPNTSSVSDTQRLLSGELVYTGMNRTSVAAITPDLPFRGRQCSVAAEVFATATDVAVLLEISPEQPLNCDTADGRPLTKGNSRNRMARLLCADRTEFTYDDALQAARYVWGQQTSQIGRALKQVIDSTSIMLESVLVCGSGELLAEAAVKSAGISALPQRLSEIIGAELSTVAPAYAIAVLASQQELEA